MTTETPWWHLDRGIESQSQDGVERDIDGYIHIYGCTRDKWCFTDGGIMCDCTCHNGEPVNIATLDNLRAAGLNPGMP